MKKILLLSAGAFLAASCSGVNYSKPKPLNYDEMGLETHHRGVMGDPSVGSPDEERLGHEKIDKLRSTGAPATAAGAATAAPATAAPATAAPPPPVPTVTGEPVKVELTGKTDLAAPAIETTLAGAAPAVKSCYEKALAAKPGLAGTVAVKLVVDKDGKVGKADIATSTLGHPDAEKCILGAAKALAFPKGKGAGSASVTKTWSLRMESPK